MEIKIFISSVQREFEEERKKLYQYIQQDALLGKYFAPYLFESTPAQDISAPTAYIKAVKECDIYIGIYGHDYGYEDSEGISPTEREYDVATASHKFRLVFLKQCNECHPKEAAFIHQVEKEVVRKRFCDYEGLQTSVYASLVRYLEEKEYLRLLPFDAAIHPMATLKDIDPDKIERFCSEAKAKRDFPIPFSAGIKQVLKNLDLCTDEGRLTNSAILLFAKRPQKFFITSEVKCVQFYGTKVEKPIPSYQVYRGSVFELVDQAVGFVMSRVDASGSDRNKGPQADIHYELPVQAVTEAIVNSVTHRDYTSNGSVQIMLFRDRLEIWNPGRLPFGLTTEKLTKIHSSKPTNPTLANAIYLAGYIERVGTGTNDMIEFCEKEGLHRPEFIEDEDFRVIIWRKGHHVNLESNRVSLESNRVSLESNRVSLESNRVSLESNRVSSESNRIVINKKQILVVSFCTEQPHSSKEILNYLNLTYQTKNVKKYITELLKADYLRPVDKRAPNDPNRKYIATKKDMVS